MSIAAIIIGLIVWLSLPEFISPRPRLARENSQPRFNEKTDKIIRKICLIAGMIIICGGIVHGII